MFPAIIANPHEQFGFSGGGITRLQRIDSTNLAAGRCASYGTTLLCHLQVFLANFGLVFSIMHDNSNLKLDDRDFREMPEIRIKLWSNRVRFYSIPGRKPAFSCLSLRSSAIFSIVSGPRDARRSAISSSEYTSSVYMAPRFRAKMTACARLRAPSLALAWCRNTFTALSDVHIESAISLLVRPRATMPSTSRSL